MDFGFQTAWDLEKLQPNDFFPIPASVVFAQRTGTSDESNATPLSGEVDRWLGETGTPNVRRVRTAITDTSASGVSPYADHALQGATIVPRCLHFVNEVENPAIIRAAQTTTVNPRRGSQDKEPWRSLDLTAITGQTVETSHVYDVHLGETVVPYATLPPLKAVLPLKRSESKLPKDADGVGGIRLGGLEGLMRSRWQTVSRLWEENKAAANRLDLSGRLDYHRELSAQLKWMQYPDTRPVRVAYTSAGYPTATLIQDDDSIVDYKLFWIACQDLQEAHYLLAIINSDTLNEAVTPFMSKGQYGARDLQKHLWKLPIPEFDPEEPLHVDIAEAGKSAADAAAKQLARLRQNRSRVTVTIARRELRAWLRDSHEGRAVEDAVGRLIRTEETSGSAS